MLTTHRRGWHILTNQNIGLCYMCHPLLSWPYFNTHKALYHALCIIGMSLPHENMKPRNYFLLILCI